MISTDDPSVKINIREYPLTDALVEKHLAFSTHVMVHKSDRIGRGHHYRLRRDQGGWYIRIAKRGQVKRYIGGCEITWIVTNGIANDPLYQFRLVP